MEEKKLKQPISEMACMHLSHLGKILSNLSVFFLILGIAGLAFIVIYPLLFVLWLFGAIATLGIIFVLYPGYLSLLTNGSEFFSSIFSVLGPLLPYFLGISLMSSVLAIIFLALDKYEKHWGRIAFSAILIGLTLIGFISIIVGAL